MDGGGEIARPPSHWRDAASTRSRNFHRSSFRASKEPRFARTKTLSEE